MINLPPLYSPTGQAEPFIRNTRNIARCRHIRSNGVQCGSPSLRGARLCYFHSRIRRPSTRNRLPILEDGNAVQCALIQVVRGILDKSIDRQTAGLLLYALQTAHANLNKVNFQPLAWDVVRDLSGAVPHMEDKPVPMPKRRKAAKLEAAPQTAEACDAAAAGEAPAFATSAGEIAHSPEPTSETNGSDALRTAIHIARAYVLGEAPSLPKPRKKRARREKPHQGPSASAAGLRSG